MNVFKQFFVSLYSPKTIATFRFQKIGKSIGYVFILMLISMIFIGLNMGLSISKATNEFATAIQEDIPNFQFENGQLTSDMDEPVIRKEGNQTFIFDTTGSVTRDDLDQYPNVIAILKNQLIVISAGSADTFNYGTMQDMNFNKKDIEGFIDSAQSFLPLIITVAIVAAYLFMTALKFIGVTVLALIGLIIKNIMKRNLPYRQLWILSAYSVTLPTIFFALMDLLRIMIPFQFLLYWGVAIFMLAQVIKFVPLPKKQESEEI